MQNKSISHLSELKLTSCSSSLRKTYFVNFLLLKATS